MSLLRPLPLRSRHRQPPSQAIFVLVEVLLTLMLHDCPSSRDKPLLLSVSHPDQMSRILIHLNLPIRSWHTIRHRPNDEQSVLSRLPRNADMT